MNVLLDFLWLLVIIIYSYVEALVKLFIPVKRKSVSGEIVLITGAGHGLGRLTAYKFAKHQSKLVLWDINKHGVEETAEACRRQGSTAYAFTVDCSNREEIYSTAEKKSHLLSSPPDPLPRELCFIVICDMYLSQTIARANKLVANHVYRNASKFRQDIDKKKEEVKREIGDVSILVNNAGVVATADLLSTQDKQIQKTFEVNILAHHWTTKAFLPAMMKNNHGHIVTVASAGGHVAVPFLVSYCSSKFAAVGFHKGLTQELSALGKNGIQTSCLCPVFINTGFIKHPSSRLLPVLDPDKVANKLMNGILCGQKMIFVPPFVSGTLFLEKILPERALGAVDKFLKIKFDAVVGCDRKEN